MIEIIALLSEDALQKLRQAAGTLSSTLGASYRIVQVASWEHLGEATTATPAICILDPYLIEGRASSLETASKALGNLPILLYGDFRGRSAAEIARLGAVVGPSRLITRGVDDAWWQLRAALLAATSAVGRSKAFAELLTTSPLETRRVLRAALECAVSARSVEALAESLELRPRTLRRRLRRVGLPPPGELLQWCLLFHVSELIDRRGLTVNRVALALGFESGSDLRRIFRRLLAVPPTTVTQRGGLECVIRKFERRINAA